MGKGGGNDDDVGNRVTRVFFPRDSLGLQERERESYRGREGGEVEGEKNTLFLRKRFKNETPCSYHSD